MLKKHWKVEPVAMRNGSEPEVKADKAPHISKILAIRTHNERAHMTLSTAIFSFRIICPSNQTPGTSPSTSRLRTLQVSCGLQMAMAIDRVRTLHAAEFLLEHGWKGVWATTLSGASRFGDEIRSNIYGSTTL
jgi:hypothetical protein